MIVPLKRLSKMKLLEKTQLGTLELKNKVVMCPMTRSRAIGSIPNDLMKEYYTQRSGAGLIITEGIAPSPNALGYARIPGLYSKEQIDGWKNITRAVHDKGTKIFAQIMHTGRVGHPDNMPDDAELLAPSALPMAGTMWTDTGGAQAYPIAKEMTSNDIQNAIEEIVQASKNAIIAGFDGIEVLAATGFLPDTFLNPKTNLRTDEYGGSLENRMRFTIEVMQKIADAIGKDKTGIRISPYGVFNDMPLYEGTEEAFTYLAKELSKIGITYVHMVDHESVGAPHVPGAVKELVKNNFEGTYIASGGFDAQSAEAEISDGIGDLVAFGKPFIANPDLVERIRLGRPFAKSDAATHYGATEKGYTDYPIFENQSMATDEAQNY